MKKSPFLQALHGCNQSGKMPIWLMRQAGRYMPSYQKLRQKYGLKQLFTNPELIIEVTQQPIDEFGVDAAILFSDILLLLDVMGLEVRYPDQGGIEVQTLTSLNDPRLFTSIGAMREKLDFLPKAIKELRSKLKVPLIGFTAAPFTLASYCLDGGKAMQGTRTKMCLWTDPLAMMQLFERLGDYLFELASLQVTAGAQVIQLFDSHTHLLSMAEYQQFVVPATKRLIERLQSLQVPLIYFTRQSSLFLPQLEKLPPCALAIDWQSDLEAARLFTKRTLQGNFNPAALMSNSERWLPLFKEMLSKRQGDQSYICNLGHGVLPSTPVDHIKLLVDTARAFGQ